jgi:hypothetical protein
MTSRRSRRRSRITLTSVLVVLALAVGGYALDATGVLGPDADAASTTTAGGPTAGETTTIGPQQTSSGATPASSPTVSRGTDADAVRARTELADLPVKGKAPATGYDRTGVRRYEGAGATVDFVRGNTTSTLVQIDHVVALENAWRTGAQRLTEAERQALANDPVNLFAVDGRSNSQKGSGDAATWLPANKAFRCTYVEHQVTVKAKYRLWVAPAERDAMVRVLDAC